MLHDAKMKDLSTCAPFQVMMRAMHNVPSKIELAIKLTA